MQRHCELRDQGKILLKFDAGSPKFTLFNLPRLYYKNKQREKPFTASESEILNLANSGYQRHSLIAVSSAAIRTDLHIQA